MQRVAALALVASLNATVALAQTSTHGLTIPAGSSILDPLVHADSKTTLCNRYVASPSTYPLIGTAGEIRMAHQALAYYCTGTYTAANGGTIDTTGDAEATLVAGTYTCSSSGNFAYNTSTDLNHEDGSRYYVDYAILTFAWLYPELSAGERNTLIACFNRIIFSSYARAYGGRTDYMNNYHWGYNRNGHLWAVASYRLSFTMPANTGAGTACAWGPPTSGLQYSFDICNDTQEQIAEAILDEHDLRFDGFISHVASRPGGVPGDGTHYGPYLWGYYTLMLFSMDQYGRDVMAETNFFIESGYQILYATSPKSTFHNFSSGTAYQFLPHGENNLEDTGGRAEVADSNVASIMTFLAWWSDGTTMEGHVRKWLTDRAPPCYPWVKLFDPDLGAAGTALTAQPLDHYSPGVAYLHVRDTWSNGAGDKPTVFMMQLGRNDGNHYQGDAGSWQAFRNARMFQETVTYGQPIPDAAGTSALNGQQYVWPHNTVTCNNFNWSGAIASTYPTVRRLTRHADFVQAVTDLRAHSGVSSSICSSMDREPVYVRGMNTLVIVDRANRAAGATPLTAILHCPTNPPAVSGNVWTCTNGTEVLRAILPSGSIAGQTVTNTEIDESAIADADCPGTDCQWQYRLQTAVTTAGAGVAYNIQVIQLLSSGDAEVSATVTDGDPFTIELTRTGATTTTISMPKGSTSATGGSITIGSTTNFDATVDTITVTSSGVSWGDAPAATPVTPVRIRRRGDLELEMR